ncbi:MAG: (2,3-dihydroxybenzoyl)adenylate synthase, partial [Anaerolineales bacterium]
AGGTLRLGIILGDAPEGFLSLTDLVLRGTKRSAEELKGIEIDPDDPAVFQLSGGTTGVPKLIPRTHNDYIYNSKAAVAVTGVGPEKVLLDVLPLAHNLPLACPGLQGFLLRGGKVVLATSTRAADIFPLIERHRVTHIHVVPALLIRWINDPLIKQFDLSSLEVIQSGGQRLQPEVRRRTKELIPSVTVQENFGMAEGMLMFVRLDDPEDVRMETVGRPISPDDEVRLVDDNDNEVAPGEVGEFLARGPYTLRGYYGAPEHNRRAFTADGFYRSGDLMRQHPSGNYLVEGRKKDLINRGGEKISAEEIENLILTHPAVQNVACIPMRDPVLGERMCACVILNSGHALVFEELVAFLTKQEIAKHKLPERMEIMDEFPMSAFGKVSKKDLTQRIALKLKEEGKL